MLRGILIDLLNEVRNLKPTPELKAAQNSLFVKYPDIIFPIGSDPELIKLEEELRNKDNFTEAVRLFFSLNIKTDFFLPDLHSR